MAGGRNSCRQRQTGVNLTHQPPQKSNNPNHVCWSGMAVEHLCPGVINAARKMQMRGPNLKGRSRVATYCIN